MPQTAPDAIALVEAYFRCAMKAANRWAARFPWLTGEFESEAVYELWRAAVDFDAERGPKFATFFLNRVRWALIRIVQRERRTSPASFGAQWQATDKHPTHPTELAADRQPDPAELVADADAQAAIPALLATLPDERRALVLRNFSGVSTYTIAEEEGRAESTIRLHIKQDVHQMRERAGMADD